MSRSRRHPLRPAAAVACLLTGAFGAAACSSTAASRAATSSSITTVITAPLPSTVHSTTTVAPTTTTDPSPNVAELAVAQQFADRAQALMADEEVHAIAVAVVRRDQVLGEFALGTSSADTPLTAESPFRMASLSKVLTAIVVLQLAEEGVVDLDRPLAEQWVDRFGVTDPRVRTITVRQLLQHTSGMPPLKETFFSERGNTWRQVGDIALATTLLTDPGAGYRYSNANYVLLGRLVEQLTGTTIDAAIATRVLQPLGITVARMNTDTHSFDPNGPKYVVGRARAYLEALGPAGDWEMSAGDMAKVLAALTPGGPVSLLRPESIAAMLTPTLLPDDEDDWSYGLGMMVAPNWFGHTGTIEDVRAIGLDTANGYTVVLLTATDEIPNGGELATVFAAELAALLALPPR